MTNKDGLLLLPSTFILPTFPVLANPPFNISDWGGERLAGDQRWAYGPPPKGNANYAWVQHIVHHLAPAGVAGFVLANNERTSAMEAHHDR